MSKFSCNDYDQTTVYSVLKKRLIWGWTVINTDSFLNFKITLTPKTSLNSNFKSPIKYENLQNKRHEDVFCVEHYFLYFEWHTMLVDKEHLTYVLLLQKYLLTVILNITSISKTLITQFENTCIVNSYMTSFVDFINNAKRKLPIYFVLHMHIAGQTEFINLEWFRVFIQDCGIYSH